MKKYISNRTKRQVICGIYRMTHIPSGKFYIGSSTDIHQRFHVHKSLFRNNKNHDKLQAAHDSTGLITDWSIKVLVECDEKKLPATELIIISQHINNPWNLNTLLDGRSGKRGKTTKTIGRHRTAAALLGKNAANKKITRPPNLIFISPTGKRYNNILSVKRFAEQQGLLQSGMNTLAAGTCDQVNGWTIAGGELPRVADVFHIWPRSRLLENYTEHVIVDPVGNKFKAFYLRHFEMHHDCKIATRVTGIGVRADTKGLTKYGQGWHTDNIPTYTVVWKNVTYKNVISPAKLSETLGIRKDRLSNYLNAPMLYKRAYSITLD